MYRYNIHTHSCCAKELSLNRKSGTWGYRLSQKWSSEEEGGPCLCVHCRAVILWDQQGGGQAHTVAKRLLAEPLRCPKKWCQATWAKACQQLQELLCELPQVLSGEAHGLTPIFMTNSQFKPGKISKILPEVSLAFSFIVTGKIKWHISHLRNTAEQCEGRGWDFGDGSFCGPITVTEIWHP